LRNLLAVVTFSLAVFCLAQDKPPATAPADSPRVFITDSESWSIAGSSGGSGGSYGGAMAGGARPQTAEIIKTFGERCPNVKVNNKQDRTDYVVLLDHEGGKGVLRHKNKVAVFNRVSGDSITSKSTLSLGGSVQEACEAITRDWSEHGVSIRAASDRAQEKLLPVAASAVAPITSAPSTAKLQVDSTPPGADIEVDGSFVGNTPSEVQVTDGDHTVVVKKSGFKDWQRKLKSSAGSSVHLSAELDKTDTSQ
jgi:ABC-type phosphate transport system substrate-binding protein